MFGKDNNDMLYKWNSANLGQGIGDRQEAGP